MSRRHASIAVHLAQDTVFLSDLGSTNGTFLGRTRVTEPVRLTDGADIKIGTVALKFRQWFPERAPGTRRTKRAKDTG